MKKILILCWLVFTVTGTLWALPTKSISFAWNASPDPTVTGYKVYWSEMSQNYTATNSVDVGNVLTWTMLNPLPQTYFLVATAYNAQALESPFSNEISFTVPKPPIQIQISGHALIINSYPGAQVQIQSSPDLFAWNPLSTIQSDTGTTTIQIDQSQPNQFYKANYVPTMEVAKVAVKQKSPESFKNTLPPLPPTPHLRVKRKLKIYEHGAEALMWDH